MKAYLAGAIEHAPDRGQAWREAMVAFLQAELGHTYYNPLVEENKYLTPAELATFRTYKESDLPRFQAIVRKLIRGDLQALMNEIDYIICLWDVYAMKGGGTYGELTVAFYRNIPVYMVTTLPVREISGWILGCTTAIYPDFPQLQQALRAKYGQ